MYSEFLVVLWFVHGKYQVASVMSGHLNTPPLTVQHVLLLHWQSATPIPIYHTNTPPDIPHTTYHIPHTTYHIPHTIVAQVIAISQIIYMTSKVPHTIHNTQYTIPRFWIGIIQDNKWHDIAHEVASCEVASCIVYDIWHMISHDISVSTPQHIMGQLHLSHCLCYK